MRLSQPGKRIWKVYLITSEHFGEIIGIHRIMIGFSKVYQCDVCLASDSVRLFLLVGHERILSLKLINGAKENVPLPETPLKACKTCLNKLRFFKVLLLLSPKARKQISNSQYKMYPHEFSPGKPEDRLQPNTAETQEPYLSHYFSQEPQEVGASQSQGESEQRLASGASEYMNTEEPCLNDYNCKCEDCQSKYGSLPILLQGIEHKYLSNKTEPQPSTSSQKVPKKLLTCEYCKKPFTHKGDFNKHLRKHTREKPFSCTVCSRTFAHTSNLQRHQRLHSGFKPFVCENCNKSFSRKDKLDCHRRSRTCSGTSSSGVSQ